MGGESAQGVVGSEAGSSCIHCLEPIKPGARRCPSCMCWQSRWAADSQNPRLELLVVFVGIVLVGVLLLTLSRARSPEPYSVPHHDPVAALEVVDAAVAWGRSEGRPFLAIVGTLTNHSQVGWRDPLFHVSFHGDQGNLVDAFSARAYGLLVPAGEKTSFKIVDWAPLSESPHQAQPEVEIRWAQEVE